MRRRFPPDIMVGEWNRSVFPLQQRLYGSGSDNRPTHTNPMLQNLLHVEITPVVCGVLRLHLLKAQFAVQPDGSRQPCVGFQKDTGYAVFSGIPQKGGPQLETDPFPLCGGRNRHLCQLIPSGVRMTYQCAAPNRLSAGQCKEYLPAFADYLPLGITQYLQVGFLQAEKKSQSIHCSDG